MAGGAAGGTGGGISTASLAWSIIMASFAAFGGILFGSASSASLCAINPHLMLYRYDTGTIGGVIAMEDWLTTFGTFTTETNIAGAVNQHYLAANNKSLVVRPISLASTPKC
jgi:hypothetical protein